MESKTLTPTSSCGHSDALTVILNNQVFTFQRNDRHIADFLWSLKAELTALTIPIPEDPLSLDDQRMEELLNEIATNPKLMSLPKVRGYFVRETKDKPSFNVNEMRVSAEIVNTCTPIKDKVSIKNPEIIQFVEALGYSELEGIADGASKAVFKAKNQRKEFVAVKITKLDEKHHVEEDIMKEVEQKMSRALFGGFLKVNRVIKDQDNQLLLVEEELANKTLRDIILEKRIKNQDFSQLEMRKIIKDLVQSLYYMHVQNQVAHRDIKPQNIFYMEHRYSFGDYGEAEKKRVNILSSNIRINMGQLKGTPMYMEPKLLKAWESTEKNKTNREGSISLTQTFTARNSFFQYDPFKADIYSLGLVFLELCMHNLGYRLDYQAENILCYQRSEPLFQQLITSIDLRSKEEKYILFGQYLYEMPSLLEMMLEEDETLRIQTFNLALLTTPKETMISHILTPFTDIFLPNKTPEDKEKDTFTVEYNYKGMLYVGQFINQKREGTGTIYHRHQNLNNIKQLVTEESEEESGGTKSGVILMEKSYDLAPIYEGEWKNDLPHGKGTLRLNDTGNTYEGYFIRGMFCGQGAIRYGQTVMYKCLWRGNYNQYILKPLKQFLCGTFRFRMVCPISKTVFGFVEKPTEDSPRRVFIIQISVEQPQLIKSILDQVFITNKKFPISKIHLQRNLLHDESEYTLSNENQSLVMVFGVDQELENWVLQRIVECMNVEKTKVIDLKRSEIGCEPFQVISKSLRCYSITQLNLSHCYFISCDTLNKFFMTSIVNSLTKINLSSTQLNNDTLRIFAESKYLVRIRELVLRGCLGVTDYALKYFVQSENVKELELLDIGQTSLAEGFTQGFLWETHFKRLRVLKIDNLSILQEDIVHLSKQDILQGLTQFHVDPLWIRYLYEFKRLRVLVLKGHSRISTRKLLHFLENWSNTRLNISAIDITKELHSYDFYATHLPMLHKSSISRLLVGCFQTGVAYNYELIKGELQILQVDMDQSIQNFKYQFQNINGRRWSIHQLVLYYSQHVLEYILSLLELDFSHTRIHTLKIVGNYSENRSKVLGEIEQNKIRFLEFCEMLKKITTVIKVKVLIIQEIFYTDREIAEMIRFKLNSPLLETLVINGTEFPVNSLHSLNNVSVNYCSLNQPQTLDETFHALSASECLSQLRGLNLFKRNNVGEKGLAHIINSKYCENIKQLNLSYTNISTNIFSLLTQSQHLILNKLTLNGIKSFEFEDLKGFVRSPNALQLRKISLKDTNLNQLSVFFLQLSLESLEEIDIKFENSLDSPDAQDLIPAMKFHNLKKIFLDLSNCQLKSVIKDICRILSSPELKKLKLSLRCCKQRDLKFCDISSLVFLQSLKVTIFEEFRVYFDETTIFENSFIVYLQTISTKVLDLSFASTIDDLFMQKVSSVVPRIVSHSLTLNLEKSQLTDGCGRDTRDLIRRLKNLEQLILNFANCKNIIHWDSITSAFPSLTQIRKLQLNLSDCKIADEFQQVVKWLDQLTKKHPIEMNINLAGCERIKMDKVYDRLEHLLEKRERFVGKVRLDVRRYRIPLDFKYKLIELNNSNEMYELLVDSSDT